MCKVRLDQQLDIQILTDFAVAPAGCLCRSAAPDLSQNVCCCLQIRLLAFHVLFQSTLNQDESVAVATDTEFTIELMGLVSDSGVITNVRPAICSCLSVW